MNYRDIENPEITEINIYGQPCAAAAIKCEVCGWEYMESDCVYIPTLGYGEYICKNCYTSAFEDNDLRDFLKEYELEEDFFVSEFTGSYVEPDKVSGDLLYICKEKFDEIREPEEKANLIRDYICKYYINEFVEWIVMK